jgi:hypothetical protein
MQSSNHQEYRKQRVAPKVIIPNTDHKDGIVDIELIDAPMSHPSLQHLFCDAQYSTIGDTALLERHATNWTKVSRYVNAESANHTNQRLHGELIYHLHQPQRQHRHPLIASVQEKTLACT